VLYGCNYTSTYILTISYGVNKPCSIGKQQQNLLLKHDVSTFRSISTTSVWRMHYSRYRLTASVTTCLRARTRHQWPIWAHPACPLVSSLKTKSCPFSLVTSLCTHLYAIAVCVWPWWVQSFMAQYSDELKLNNEFRQFVINASLLYGGHNTVAEQLQINKSWAAKKGYLSHPFCRERTAGYVNRRAEIETPKAWNRGCNEERVSFFPADYRFGECRKFPQQSTGRKYVSVQFELEKRIWCVAFYKISCTGF